MERAENEKRLKLLDEKIQSNRELSQAKLKVQNLKQQYWERKLQEAD
jgi:hypothetical protein